jgi:hypothetical protein
MSKGGATMGHVIPPHSDRQFAAGPWIALLGLLGVCVVHGVRTTADVSVPPDPDALRDIGFAQGMLDGNLFGDPVSLGEVRHYPPLVPALGALVARLTHSGDLPGLWVALGPWAGLMPVVGFFFLTRRLFASDAAAIMGTACFVLLNGLTVPPWVGGGYTPWLLTPLLTQAAFLGTAWVIRTRVERAAWLDAVLIGLAIGVTFLGHVVPALLLTGMLIAAVWVVHGVHWRIVLWLALAGTTQLLAMAPALLPLQIAYPRGIVSTAPGMWVAEPLAPGWASFGGFVLLNAPCVAGFLMGWRLRAPIARCTAAMLVAWTGLCGLFLARHYGCMAMAPDATVCAVFRVPVHHFLLYLQVAGACLAGWGAWAVWRSGVVRRDVLALVAAVMLVAGVAGFAMRPYDRFAREMGVRHIDRLVMDRAVYRWVLGHVPPNGLFVTGGEGRMGGDLDPAAFAVMAAGRKLVATDEVFSNPYVDWASRDAARRTAIAWLMGEDPLPRCADFATGLWAVLGRDVRVQPERATAVFESGMHRVYRVIQGECAG